jgi:hypothetical protein
MEIFAWIVVGLLVGGLVGLVSRIGTARER